MFTAPQFQRKLLGWFDQNGRKNLPWQHDKTPYRVWVAEIMLQQTQVATVIPYYLRFMQTFPSIAALASSDLDQVLHLWTGLGYYSRAKNLHNTARIIMSQFAGDFPSQLSDLLTLPGIGTSTAGAIRACAFNHKATILDGNVKRVLTRLYGITEPINQKEIETQLWEIAEKLTPSKRIADYTQAMMDLGATLCTRSKPLCTTCPMQTICKAKQTDIVDQLPNKIRKKPIPVKQTCFLILQYKQEILLEKRTHKGVWQGLWSFPEVSASIPLRKIKETVCEEFGVTIAKAKTFATFRHTFSHYHLDITPIHLAITKKTHKKIAEDKQLWYSLQTPNAIGLPKPIKQLLDQIYHANNLLR